MCSTSSWTGLKGRQSPGPRRCASTARRCAAVSAEAGESAPWGCERGVGSLLDEEAEAGNAEGGKASAMDVSRMVA